MLLTFVLGTGLPDIHYVILLPPLEVCLERMQGRVGHDFSDLLITRDLYEQFANADVGARHLITEPGDHPAELAELISQQLHDGRFRYSAL